MDKKEKPIPFGLIFEETAPEPQGPIIPTYDEETDLSYVVDSRGRQVPYVEFKGTQDEDANRLSHLTGTQTATRTWGETTDADPDDDRSRRILGTVTITKEARESTDKD